MIRRTLELLLLVLLGAAPGWDADSAFGAMAGAMGGALLWMVIDGLRAARLMRWLKVASDGRPAPRLPLIWGDFADQVRRNIKKFQRQAQASEARLEEFLAAIQASPNGVVLLDPRDAIEWCNLTASQHLGFDPQKDLRQYIKNLVRDPGFADYLSRGDFGKEFDVVGRRAVAGSLQRISIQIHPYAKGRKLLLTRDVTAVQLAEAMRRDFVANVSHEIRTPLTVLSGFVETMQTLELTDDERRRYLGLMAEQARRMLTVVSDLLTLSRLEGSPMPGHQDVVPLRELLDQVVHEARALSEVLAEGRHEIVALDCPDAGVCGNRGEWLSAMSNLLSNAVRYTPAGGRIEAGWRLRPDGGVEFSVCDTGPGIAAEHLPRLTERFYRVDRSRSRETGGTGLGLAIVKHVAQRHGGQMQVHSEVGKGSTFTIAVPATRVRAVAHESGSEAEATASH